DRMPSNTGLERCCAHGVEDGFHNPLVGVAVGGFRSFFLNDTPTTGIYTLSLHDALPILGDQRDQVVRGARDGRVVQVPVLLGDEDRKSTRLNSSHLGISYAVFCLKKKKIFWNPKLKVDNAYAPIGWFYRVNSVFYDPSIY